MRHRLAVVALLLASLGINVAGIGWGLPNAYSWSNDDPTPRRALNIPGTFRDGWDQYPYLQLWIDYAVYAPTLRALYAAGDVDPTCAELKDDCFQAPHEALGTMQWLSRWVSALMGAGICLAVYATTRRLTRRRAAALAAAAAVASSQVVVFFSHVGNVDVPYAFWFAWSLYALVAIAQGGGWVAYGAFGALAAAALATKEQVVGAYVLPVAALVAGGLAGSRARLPLLALAAALAVAVYGTVNNVWFNPAGFRERIDYWLFGQGIDPWNDAYRGPVALLTEFVRQSAQGMGVPLLAVAAVGLLIALRRPERTWPLWLTLASYVAFTILAVRYSFVRFTLPAVIVLASCVGVLVAALADAPRRSVRRLGGAAVGVAIALATVGSLQVVWLLVHDARYAAEDWLRDHAGPETRIEVIGSKTHLPRLDYLGLDFERVPDESLDGEALAARDHELLIVSSRSFDELEESDPGLVSRMLGGRAGYRVAFDAQTLPPVPWILGTVFIESRVNPRILILERDRKAGPGAQRESAP